ncbi:hypothetical protein N9N67_00770 [Bacteriovoracaceae bacterium]|nr:hypothetical protein [Bacteriovoracaceae bacterium]
MYRSIMSSLSLLFLLIGCGKGNGKYQPFETLDGIGANAPLPEGQTESLKSTEFLSSSVPGVIPDGKKNAKFSLIENKDNRFAQISLSSQAVAGDHRARIKFTDVKGESISSFKYMSYYTRAKKVISSPQINNLVSHLFISPNCDENDSEVYEIVVDYMVTEDSAGLNMGPGPIGQMNKYQFQSYDKVYMAGDDSLGSGLPHISSGMALNLNSLLNANPNACFSDRGIELVFGREDSSNNDSIDLDDVRIYFDAGPNNRITYNYNFEDEVNEEQAINYLSSL